MFLPAVVRCQERGSWPRWARGADGVEEPDSALPQKLDHSLRADGRLERKESELPRAFAWASVHAARRVGEVVRAFCELPCQHVGVRGVGAREQSGRRPSAAVLVTHSTADRGNP
jgi:hypothetical protein